MKITKTLCIERGQSGFLFGNYFRSIGRLTSYGYQPIPGSRTKTRRTIILPMAVNAVLKLNIILPEKRVKLDIYRLEEAIELTRAEMLMQLYQTGYNLCDTRIIQTSRKLDRLLNQYYCCNSKPE